MRASQKEAVIEGCTFCAIARGDIPAAIVLDEKAAVAFLDHRPIFPGHVLVATRDHSETLLDLPQDQIGDYFEAVQRVARAVERAMEADGTFVAINNRVSQSVPHLHTHVVPRRRKDGLRGFFWPRTKYESEAQQQQTAESIRRVLSEEW
jgi:histidine triad (HIT) family protein